MSTPARPARTIADLAAAAPVGASVSGDRDVVIHDITHDSREVRAGTMFVSIVGAEHDGHQYAESAVNDGASALLVERLLPIDVPQIVVDDTRYCVGAIAAALFDHPSASMTTVGITGTNGKTTTAHLLSSILDSTIGSTEVLGTLTGPRTTPEATDLQRHLAQLRDAGRQAVVMEVSSHAMALHRVNGTNFDVSVFTNLGRDHLDLHKTMEEYFRAKASLFDRRLSAIGVTNTDDPYGRLLLDVAATEMVPYSIADALDVTVTARHHSFTWRGRPVAVQLGGSFNVWNSLAALTAATALGIDAGDAASGLSESRPVPGRFELVTGEQLGVGPIEFDVIVDYAHTPDGLTELLAAARNAAGTGRVLAVFGCGGDRDREKRPMMGAAAAQGADWVIVTSDNPRTEPPDSIIASIVAGVPEQYRERVATEADRRMAIATAVGEARAGDVVVIAGKGHETTQTIGATHFPFDDRAVARELLEELL